MVMLAALAVGAPSSLAISSAAVSPDPNAAVGSRANPIALGSTFDLPTWRVTVDAVDPDAWPKIQAANDYNTPPADGHQFVMFHVTTAYLGDETGSPSFDLTWSIVDAGGDTFGTTFDDY